MSVSGVVCDPCVTKRFEEFKKSGVEPKVDYIVCTIQEGKIVLEAAPDYGATAKGCNRKFVDGVPVCYLDMEEKCLKGGCRYAFYTFRWVQSDGHRNSIVLIQYCDDNACSKDKLTFSTSKNALTKACSGVNHVIEANDKDELNYFEILKHISKCKAIIEKDKNE